MANLIVDVQNLVKRYRKADKNAVDNISFSVKHGEFFALLGPNGAGKTTTISILTTTLSKTSGEVSIAGFDIEKQSSLVRKNVGIIFQNPSLDQNLSAEENIRFHAILYGLYNFAPSFDLMPQQYKNRVMELAEVIGLKNEIFKQVKTFSGGMKRKLEIIRSLMHKPKVLFLDEPTSGLDPLSRKNLWEYLTEVRKTEKMTIFLTTHYLEEAEDADNVCIINKGKIVMEGTPESIKNNLLSEELIIDSHHKTELREELTKLELSFVEKEIFEVNIQGKNMQEVINSIKTPLFLLKTHNPSLEDAYLSIVEEKEQK
jgi:ABC-2 type transport system ATP-binding protein